MNIILAIGNDGSIGRNGDLIWKISSDLKRFKTLTTGHTVVMGRKTWESLPKRPLPGRRNIVLTRNPAYEAPGAEIMASVKDVMEKTKGEKVFIMGGAEIYKAFLPYTSTLWITHVDSVCPDADVFIDLNLKMGWNLVEAGDWTQTDDKISYRFATYTKK